jgi:hypothetical protein
MNRRLLGLVFFIFIVCLTSTLKADAVEINDYDTVVTVLTAHVGKRVTVRLNSGQELSGTVTEVTENLTHLSELTGMEFYDAVIVNADITAVVIRTQ